MQLEFRYYYQTNRLISMKGRLVVVGYRNRRNVVKLANKRNIDCKKKLIGFVDDVITSM